MSFSASSSASARPTASAGPRQRQRDGAKHLEAPGAERARDLDHRCALGREHRPRRRIDVRVEHDRHDEDAAGERADLRKPVLGPRAPPHRLPQRRLHRTGGVEHFDVDVGGDVGRHRERQRQEPGEPVASREAVHRDEPGGADAEGSGQERDAGEEQGGLEERCREHVAASPSDSAGSPRNAMMASEASGASDEPGGGEEHDDRPPRRAAEGSPRRHVARAGEGGRRPHGLRRPPPARLTCRNRPCRRARSPSPAPWRPRRAASGRASARRTSARGR